MSNTLRIILLGLVFFFQNSCGDRRAKYDVEQKVSGITWPTQENADAWKKLWDERSWIVALASEQPKLKDHQFFRLQVLNSFKKAIAKRDPSFSGFVALEQRFSSVLRSQVLAIPNFERHISAAVRPLPVFGFATLSLKGGFGSLENMLLTSTVFENALRSFDQVGKNQFLLKFFWNTLEDIPGVEFAEPDLQSDILREPESVKNILSAQHNTSNLGLKEIVDQMASSGQSVVAVIDTGVDGALDGEGQALQGRLYRNPGEDPSQGKKGDVDDDNNGWVDDFIGVNSTIAKGEIDFSPMPVPGSSDVGGQGKACDVVSENDKNSQSCGHGSHVAGIIAGFNDQYSGVCPYNCKILPIRAARRCFGPKNVANAICEPADEFTSFNPETMREFDGGISDSSQLRALAYLLDLETTTGSGILVTNVVNLSIGKYFSSRSLSLISRRVIQNDILMVAAAGNQNVEIPMFPAAYRDVVAVCATSKDGSEPNEPTGSSDTSKGSGPVRGARLKARFSNFGDWVDICAPGSFISSSVPGGNVERKSGTSQASPHVSGVAGMLKALRPGLSAMDIRSILLRYADFDFLYGALSDGRLANADFEFSPYPDSKVFLLGSGFLSAGNAYNAIFNPARAKVSQADSAIEAGDTSQVTSGCVVSSLASHHPLKTLEWTSSMPLLLLFGLFILKLFARN